MTCILADSEAQAWNAVIRWIKVWFLPKIVTLGQITQSYLLTSGKSSFITDGLLSSPLAESVSKCRWKHVRRFIVYTNEIFLLTFSGNKIHQLRKCVSYNSNTLLQLSNLNIRDKTGSWQVLLLVILFSTSHILKLYISLQLWGVRVNWKSNCESTCSPGCLQHWKHLDKLSQCCQG